MAENNVAFDQDGEEIRVGYVVTYDDIEVVVKAIDGEDLLVKGNGIETHVKSYDVLV